MGTGFKQESIASDDSKHSKFLHLKDFRAKITETIGHGEDAKNSLIYLTLKWSFYSGIFLTLIVMINYWIFLEEPKEHFSKDILSSWEKVIPIITLALGYAFGKSKK